MQSDVRGLFVLDPPSGGLSRLRHAMRDAEQEARWMPLMPWATAAGLLLAILLSVHRGGAAVTARIVEEVRGQEEAGAWTELHPDREGPGVYLARPTREERQPQP